MRLKVIAVAAFAVFGLQAGQGSEQQGAAAAARCEAKSEWEKVEYRCPLDGEGGAQRLLFRVNFSGGHDDTMASMQVTLDDQPYTCVDGSITELRFLNPDAGDVSMECRIALPPGRKPRLGVTVKYTHADYVGYELRADGAR